MSDERGTGPKLPAGLRIRPYAGAADIAAIVEIMNSEWQHDGVPSRVTVGDRSTSWRRSFDPGSFEAR